MTKNDSNSKTGKKFSAQPRLHQRAAEIQAYGTVNPVPAPTNEAICGWC